VRRLLLTAAALGILAGCGDDPPAGPSSGVLEIRLSGPAGAGAALLLVEGGTIDTVEAAGYFTASAANSATARRVLVAGQDLGGTLVRIGVPDRRTAYRATLIEIADGTSYQLLDPTGFTLSVGRP
jgi:hypothetical protein